MDKSNNLAVDQLERLYSLLSQCIYRHRKDYDKSQLVEVSVQFICRINKYLLLLVPKKREKKSYFAYIYVFHQVTEECFEDLRQESLRVTV